MDKIDGYLPTYLPTYLPILLACLLLGSWTWKEGEGKSTRNEVHICMCIACIACISYVFIHPALEQK